MPGLSFKDSIELRDILIPDDSSDFSINVKSKTHIGRIREENQDNLSILLPPTVPEGVLGIISVADGMGGHKGGAEASKITVKSLAKSLVKPLTTRSTREILKNAFDLANQSVFSESQKPELSGMGTTLTTAIITSHGVTIGHVGDSRAYLFRNSKLYQLTNDHTWVAEQIQNGELSKIEAQNHPKKNMITRAIGIKNNLETDISSFSLKDNDTLLICSDGLHGQIQDIQIKNILNTKDLEIIVDSLVKSANKSGGIDNVTVITVNFSAQNTQKKEPYGFFSLFSKEEESSLKKTIDRLGVYTDLEPLDKINSRNIYKAWDHDLKKQVIIKTDLNAETKKFNKEFDIHNEAKCHSKVTHSNVVSLINYNIDRNYFWPKCYS
jgi:protein phosphatase